LPALADLIDLPPVRQRTKSERFDGSPTLLSELRHRHARNSQVERRLDVTYDRIAMDEVEVHGHHVQAGHGPDQQLEADDETDPPVPQPGDLGRVHRSPPRSEAPRVSCTPPVRST